MSPPDASRFALPRHAALRAGCVGLAILVGTTGLAAGEGLGLRPAMTATSYIHVVPAERFSAGFAGMIRTAVQKSNGVQAAAARWRAEEQGIAAATGAQLPSAVLYGEAGLATGKTSTPYAYGVRVAVPLYDGFGAGFATAAQGSLTTAARLAAMDELAATLVDLVAAAAAIRRAEDTLDARRAQHAAMQDLLAAIVSEREAGTATRVDTDQVEAQLSQIEIELKAAETARLQARESFAGIAGEPPASVGAIGSLSRFLPANAASAMSVALADNPQLGQRLALADAARLTRQSAEAGLGPDLSLNISAGVTGDLMGTSPAAMDARAMLRLEVPLSFGADAVVQKRALEAQAASFEADAARLGVAAGLTGAYARLETSRTSLALANDALVRARSVLTGMQSERELGERSLFDVMTAQNALAEAKIRVSGLQYEITVAEHLLAAQIGQLDDIYGVVLN